MAFVQPQKHKRGDRADGHWVKDAPGMNVIMTGLYPHRCDNEVCAFNEIDVTDLLEFIKKHNEENPDIKIGFFHCFVTALTRLFNERRKLNRFIRRGRIYERDEITTSFIAKKKFNDQAHEVVVTYKGKKDDTVEDVAKNILDQVADVRKEEVISNDDKKKSKNITESLDTYGKWPTWFLLLVTRLLRVLNYYGKVPKSIKKGDPAFASILISNLGSIKSNSIYHHLNDYGTNSVLITIGTIEKKEIIHDDGSREVRDIVNFSFVADERIADGFYFVQSFKLLEKYLTHPESLMIKFDEDVNIED